jgi:hypothetical protein
MQTRALVCGCAQLWCGTDPAEVEKLRVVGVFAKREELLQAGTAWLVCVGPAKCCCMMVTFSSGLCAGSNTQPAPTDKDVSARCCWGSEQ